MRDDSAARSEMREAAQHRHRVRQTRRRSHRRSVRLSDAASGSGISWEQSCPPPSLPSFPRAPHDGDGADADDDDGRRETLKKLQQEKRRTCQSLYHHFSCGIMKIEGVSVHFPATPPVTTLRFVARRRKATCGLRRWITTTTRRGHYI